MNLSAGRIGLVDETLCFQLLKRIELKRLVELKQKIKVR